MSGYAATNSENSSQFFTGRKASSKIYHSYRDALRSENTQSNVVLLELYGSDVDTEKNHDKGVICPDIPDQVVFDPDVALTLDLQKQKIEQSTSVSAFQFDSGDFFNQAVAIKEAIVRIEKLKGLAAEECIKFSEESERDLRLFLASVEFTRRPYIALLDNGNFRAIWRNANREQIGLQFRGHDLVQYVLFALRSSDRFMAQATGRDKLLNVRRMIEVQGLGRLMSP